MNQPQPSAAEKALLAVRDNLLRPMHDSIVQRADTGFQASESRDKAMLEALTMASQRLESAMAQVIAESARTQAAAMAEAAAKVRWA